MSKKKYTIRLYLKHDLDLISFCELHMVNLTKAVYCVLSAFAKGETFVITMPPKRQASLEKKRIYYKKIVLDTETDQNAIQLLESIVPGYRNCFIKNLLRQYLCMPITEEFAKDQNAYEELTRMCVSLQSGRKLADAASITKKEAPKRKRKPSAKPKKETEAPLTAEHSDWSRLLQEAQNEMQVSEEQRKPDQALNETSPDSSEIHSDAMTYLPDHNNDTDEKASDQGQISANTVSKTDLSVEVEDDPEEEFDEELDVDELTEIFSGLLG